MVVQILTSEEALTGMLSERVIATGVVTTGAGAGAGAGAAAGDGAGADIVFVICGAEAAGGRDVGVAPAEMEPSARETSLGGAVLPEKNSAAESAGSADGAGG